MSELVLATKYSEDNYPKALDNLTKRYQKESEAIHYKDVAFDGLSPNQANSTLKFFGDIGLLDVPKQAHYVPPEPLVTWQRSIEGPAKDEAKEKVKQRLSEYKVFEEALFLLDGQEKELDDFVREVGGTVGIDQDEVGDLQRTIKVFAELGFLSLDGDIVSLPEDSTSTDTHEEGGETTAEEKEEEEEHEQQAKEEVSDAVENGKDATPPETEEPIVEENERGRLVVELDVSINATEMEPDDLQKKLEIIEDVVGHDEE